MVEQLHTEVLSGVDKLELQLRHDSDDQTPGQVRTTKDPPSRRGTRKLLPTTTAGSAKASSMKLTCPCSP